MSPDNTDLQWHQKVKMAAVVGELCMEGLAFHYDRQEETT